MLKYQDIVTYKFDDMTSVQFSEQYNTKPGWGYFFVAVKQGTQYCKYKWERNAIFITLATAGGFIGTFYLLLTVLFSDYVSFTFDKSLMKRLYS